MSAPVERFDDAGRRRPLACHKGLIVPTGRLVVCGRWAGGARMWPPSPPPPQLTTLSPPWLSGTANDSFVHVQPTRWTDLPGVRHGGREGRAACAAGQGREQHGCAWRWALALWALCGLEASVLCCPQRGESDERRYHVVVAVGRRRDSNRDSKRARVGAKGRSDRMGRRPQSMQNWERLARAPSSKHSPLFSLRRLPLRHTC